MKDLRIQDLYPLTPMQEGMLFHTRYAPQSGVYSQQIGFLLTGRLDTASFRAAWCSVVERHDALRTGFAWEQRDHPLQAVFEHVEMPWTEVDLRGMPAETQQERLSGLIDADRAVRYDLKRPPLMRLLLVRLAEDRYQCLWSMHHLIIDGWSVSIILGELRDLYAALTAGKAATLPAATQFRAHVAWLRGQDLATARDFWRAGLAGFTTPTPLLGDQGGAEPTRYELTRYASAEVAIDDEATRRLRLVAQQQKITLNTLLQGAWALLLSRQSGEPEVVFGVVSSGRSQTVPGIESIVGLCVNTLPARVPVAAGARLTDWLASIQVAQVENRQFEYCPLTEIQGWSDVHGGRPLFDSIVGTENFPLDLGQVARLGDVAVDVNLLYTKTSAPLSLIVLPGRQLVIRALYDADRWSATAIDASLARYRHVLSAFAADPDTTVGAVGVLPPAEYQEIVIDRNRTTVDLPDLTGLQDRVRRQARRTPDAVAVRSDRGTLTYADLIARADRLAGRLRAAGVTRGTLVGLCVARSPELVVGALAAWQAGGAYLPLDPDLPDERLAFIVADAGPAVVVVGPQTVGRITGSGPAVVELEPDTPRPDDPAPADLGGGCELDDLAYVIYTSGSTGQPKGVPITHRSLANLVNWHQRTFGLTPHDRATLIAAPGFDASVWEIWPYLSCGASLSIPPARLRLSAPALVRWLAEQQITVTFLPTPLAELAVREPWPTRCRLRYLLTGGDRLRHAPPEGLPFRLVNNYGPTENTVVTTSTVVAADRDDTAAPPIGRPIDNTRVYVLDAGRQPVPPGVPGELFVAGTGLAQGYLNRPEISREAFVPNPFEPGGTMYRTGDVVRYRPDGQLQFVGRNDEQVKIHGYRIELGEIEATLSQHPAVRQAAVTTQDAPDGSPRLVGYFVPRSPHDVAPESTAAHVDAWLTLYDETYRQPAPVSEPDLNIVGWQSSYTGEAIPADVMAEQVEATAERILRRRPRRILEIGCGTGMLLFRIAPHCTEYWALDFSAEALAFVRRQPELARWPHVHLLQRTADDLSGFEPEHFDAVIINSVVQYFPDPDYLARVLRAAVTTVRRGGFVFVGDVRNHDLVEAFHSSVLLHQAAGSMSLDMLRRSVLHQTRLEKELLVSPRYFAAMSDACPEIGFVEVDLRRGTADSEITRYRYDVVLHVGPPVGPVNPVRVSYPDRPGTVDPVPGRPLLITDVPNDRIWADHLAWQEIRAGGPRRTVDDLREWLAAEPATGICPESWWHGVDPARHEVRSRWSPGDPARYDVLISDRTDPPVPWPYEVDLDHGTGTHTTNDPQLAQWLRGLVPGLRGFLANRLPSYLVPATIIALQDMPTTINGKIDRSRLPAAAEDVGVPGAEFIEPRTALEATLARIWSHVLGVEQVSVTADFFDLGGHSLMVAQLVAQIQRECDVQLPLRLFFENSSVARAAHLIEHTRRHGVDPLPDTSAALDLTAESTLDPAIRPGPQDRTAAVPEGILLTGATGFLGGFLLKELLAQTRSQVYPLVRGAADTAAALDRIRSSLTRLGIWEEDWRGRITPVIGDLARPALGMTARQFDELADRVGAIYHNGAQVNMVLPYRALRAANVGGTTELLRLAVRHGRKPVHYVSSLTALYLMRPDHPQTEIPLTFEELDQHLLASASNGYGVSKFVAEQILRVAAARGIPVTVYRPGSISGHSRTGAANTADFLHAMLRESLQMGCLPDDIRLDPVPVDFVSRALVRLSLTPAAAGRHFHLTNPRPIAVDDFLEWSRSRGFAMRLVDRKQWLRVATEHSRSAGHPLGAFATLLPTLLDFHGTHRFMQAGIRQPDMTNTVLGLAGSGIVCPPVDHELLDTYLDYFIDTGFMAPVPART